MKNVLLLIAALFLLPGTPSAAGVMGVGGTVSLQSGGAQVSATNPLPTTSGPARSVATVTPSDSTSLPGGISRSLFIGTGGDVSLIAADGTGATFVNVPSGSVIPVQTKRVNATATTATNILALY